MRKMSGLIKEPRHLVIDLGGKYKTTVVLTQHPLPRTLWYHQEKEWKVDVGPYLPPSSPSPRVGQQDALTLGFESWARD